MSELLHSPMTRNAPRPSASRDRSFRFPNQPSTRERRLNELAVLVAYASETFPTRIRARGTGLAAGASKLGGLGIVGLIAAGVAAPSIATTALIGALPMALAAVAMLVVGVETRHRQLEDITAEELRLAPNG